MRREEVFSVQGDAELVTRAGHLFDSARTEFLCAARDLSTWTLPGARRSLSRRTPDPGSPHFTVRKLFSPAALVDEEARAHIRRVRHAGAGVRISGSPLPHETIMIDRRIMILAGQETPAGREYTVTTAQPLIDGVHSLFDALWNSATDPDTWLRTAAPDLDQGGRAVLDALASGLTDEAAARRLGLSLRTYRRRVAGLMDALEAGSRFQAGLRAGALGLSGRGPGDRRS